MKIVSTWDCLNYGLSWISRSFPFRFSSQICVCIAYTTCVLQAPPTSSFSLRSPQNYSVNNTNYESPQCACLSSLLLLPISKIPTFSSVPCFQTLTLSFWGWGSSVSIVSDYRLEDRAIGVRSPAEAKDVSSISCVQAISEAHPASYPKVISPEVKAAGA
jgi:hypothetical protein